MSYGRVEVVELDVHIVILGFLNSSLEVSGENLLKSFDCKERLVQNKDHCTKNGIMV